ncbi:MAG: imidazoleglycerol-phosphate dehydratase HisB [Treponemataceae bacterium]|nr:MAG: imidazoleglycerol-phosphate dehydratase HisB [Treponemataceae bacterium]
MKSRIAKIDRKTKETEITISLNVDGNGECSLECPIGFFEHMLTSFCKHGLFDIAGTLKGDLHVDNHHLIEDAGIVLGCAFAQALGDCAGIFRAGSCTYPMDETLVRAAVDFGGRPCLVFEGEMQDEIYVEFWQGFVSGAKCNLHIDIIRGRSDHHKNEAVFKAVSRALRDATEIDIRRGQTIPSTKGVIV